MEEKMMQLQAKLETSPELAEKLVQQETPQEAQAILNEAGLDFTQEEVVELGEILMKAADASQGELSEEDLDDVAGGAVITAGAIATGIAIAKIVGGTAATAGFVHNVTRGRW